MIGLFARVAVAGAVALGGTAAFNKMSLNEYQVRCNNAHSTFEYTVMRSSLDTGIIIVLKEAHRPVTTAMEYAKRGIGIANSLHTLSLARDYAVFYKGVYQTEPGVHHKQLGDLWKAIGKEAGIDPSWGGDFKSVDAVHFGCAWRGVR